VNKVLLVLTAIGWVVALMAFWRAVKLGHQVQELKRKTYDTEQQIKNIPGHIDKAVDPLRIQLACVAEGITVSPELIRSGRFYQDLTAEEAEHLMFSGNTLPLDGITILDVRTAKEYEGRHISGAQLVPIEELDRRFRAEIPRSGTSIFVYCARGERSRLACDFLSHQGYVNLYNIRNGLQQWQGPTKVKTPTQVIQIQSIRKSHSHREFLAKER